MKQLYELSRKFPKDWIKKAPKGKFGNYVPHPVITQRLLEVCGPFDWEVVELIRQENTGSVVGCFGKLTVEIDGKLVTVTSIGDVEHDQKNDGSNAKHAESDSFKRCAMKLGLGLHLWAGEEYYLDKSEPNQRDNENQEGFNERFARWQDKRSAAEGKAEIIVSKQRHGPTGVIQSIAIPAELLNSLFLSSDES